MKSRILSSLLCATVTLLLAAPALNAATDHTKGSPAQDTEASDQATPTDPAHPADQATPTDAGDPAEPVAPPDKVSKDLSHRYQVGLEVGVGVGYSFLITYRDTTWCGELDGGDNASFCTGMHPAFLDLGLSFGVLHRLDILAEVRLGLMDDPTRNRPLMLMPGLRLWVDPDKAFKIGIGFQLVLDLTRQKSSEQQIYGPPVKGETLDLGGRIFGQFQYDFLRYVGIYAKIGASITARRWLGVHLDGQVGVQTRFP